MKRRLRSRARWLLVLIPAVVLLFWWGLTPYVPGSTHHIGEHLIRFEIDTSPRENAQRVAELHEVLDLLPAHLIEPLGSVKIIVSGAPDLCDHFWASGCAWRDASQIGIHQRSDADAYPWDWEHFATNGYTHLERVTVLVHEFGHLVDFHVLTWEQRAAFNDVRRAEPESVTSYGDTERAEDFADTFAFYVLWPDYLERYYPKRYAIMYDIFGGITHESRDAMPSSVQARLPHPWPLNG